MGSKVKKPISYVVSGSFSYRDGANYFDFYGQFDEIQRQSKRS